MNTYDRKTDYNKPYMSCHYIESGIVCYPDDICICCDSRSPIRLPIAKERIDFVRLIDDFLVARNELIVANQEKDPPCAGCPEFHAYKNGNKKISYINLSTHGYCQFLCIYCTLQKGGMKNRNRENYDCLDIAIELKKRGLLAEGVHIDCAPGEITVHPRKNEFYDFIDEYSGSVTFYSNAGKFDSRLANILSSKQSNKMIVSLDCGTPETFRLVHGVDMFDKVIDSLHKYRENGVLGNQIVLKYIILKENHNEKDLIGFITICKKLDVKRIIISTDYSQRYIEQKEPEDFVVDSAVTLIQASLAHAIDFSMTERALGHANLDAIYGNVLKHPEFSSSEALIDEVFSAQNLICYGTGRNCQKLLAEIRAAGLRMPDVIWDRKAGSEAEMDENLGLPICSPDFESLDNRRDAVLITIADNSTNRELIDTMRSYGFTRVISQHDLFWGLKTKK